MSPLLEPLGLLYGREARMAVASGVARMLAGGPAAFTLVRQVGRDDHLVPVASAPAVWRPALTRLSLAPPCWAGLKRGPLVMGVLNVTPDSFSDGGDTLDVRMAVEMGRRMVDAGAAILDIGGESTRPGAAPVSPEREQRRVLPVVAALAGAGAPISIDTRNADTMAKALDLGAAIVNDVSALAHDPAAAGLIAARGCPVILMHTRGDPNTMAGRATYNDVAAEVLRELAERVAAAEEAGISRGRIAIDPGFGFAKTADQSRELLRRLPVLLNLACPIIAGLSRKSFIGRLAGVGEPKARGPGSVTAGLFALARGAAVLRVHDVAETVQALRVWQGLAG